MRKASILVRQQRIKAGFYVARRGSPPQHWTCVLEGQVRLHLTAPDGNQTALLHINKGESFDESVLVAGGNRSYDAITVRETSMLQIPAHVFHWLVANQPSFAQHVMKLIAARSENLARTIESDRLYDTSRRVARCVAALVEHAQAQGRSAFVRMPQRELGMLSGVSRQRTNAAIRRLTSLNILRSDTQGLSIADMQALRDFAGIDMR